MALERALRIGKRGEIVIPSEFRRALGLLPGQRVRLAVDGNKVVLSPLPDLGTALYGSVKAAPGAPSIEDIVADLDEDLT